MGFFGKSPKYAVGKFKRTNGEFVEIAKEFEFKFMAEQWARSQFSLNYVYKLM